MRLSIAKAALAGVLALLLSTAALAAAPALDEASIDSADFNGWQSRQGVAANPSEAEPAKAPADGTAPDASATPPAAATTPAPNPAASAASAPQDNPAPPTGATNGATASAGGALQPGPAAKAGEEEAPKHPDPFLIRLQVLLDRAHASPGVIDGFFGDNTKKAIRVYRMMRKLPPGDLDADLWTLLAVDQGKAMKTYEVTREDVDGRYVKEIPHDYAAMAKMKWLGFRGPAEMLAERFHMDEDLLKTLNPKADFSKVGTKLLVADPDTELTTKVARIVVDKSAGGLFAYDESGALVLGDPATIGSEDTPSPSGTVKVKGVAKNPPYSYDPSKNFKQGKNSKPLTIPPGPNGPVGSIWIDLDKPTYGIHGTPDPSRIDKTNSHGCVRLTNWDAWALSKLVMPLKTVVEFKG